MSTLLLAQPAVGITSGASVIQAAIRAFEVASHISTLSGCHLSVLHGSEASPRLESNLLASTSDNNVGTCRQHPWSFTGVPRASHVPLRPFVAAESGGDLLDLFAPQRAAKSFNAATVEAERQFVHPLRATPNGCNGGGCLARHPTHSGSAGPNGHEPKRTTEWSQQTVPPACRQAPPTAGWSDFLSWPAGRYRRHSRPLAAAQLLFPAASTLAPGRSYQTISASLREDIATAAVKKQTGVSLKYLLDFGTQPLERQMLLSARFLHAEIPIRLAHRLMDLNRLPPGLSDEPHVRRVKGWYAESFADFRSFPAIKDNMDVVRFTAMLKNAFRRHNNVVPAIAKGVEEYKRELERTGESCQERENEIQHFLDTFFLSRIAIRFLAGHHISMFEPARPDHIGLVHTKCSPFMVASDAVQEARAMCFREYGSAPSATVLGNSELTMAYVPSHLHHMVFELVKNSLRAVQERFAESDNEPPPIQVVVAEGLEDVTIKVSDQGGGIPRSGLHRIWTYLYTTARSPLPDLDIDSTNMPAVLAGYGCGLPLSRLYARYFGGDLQIISMEGYGTDAYLHLARLGNDEEPLPGAVIPHGEEHHQHQHHQHHLKQQKQLKRHKSVA